MRFSRIAAFRMASLLCVAALVSTAPALAQDMGLRGWGPRVGFASSPDQAVAGLHFDVGEFAPRVHFVPNFEIGFGDDHTVLSATAPVIYRWDQLEGNIRPFAGGGLTVGWIDHDHPLGRFDDGEDSEVEVAFEAIGGIAWKLESGTDFSVELNILMGDLWDVQFLAGWMFKP